MAMVKVCDKCGAPIIEAGSRLLWKVTGDQTYATDLCQKCTMDFFGTYNAQNKAINADLDKWRAARNAAKTPPTEEKPE